MNGVRDLAMTDVVLAHRAMAFLKARQFEDCQKAIALLITAFPQSFHADLLGAMLAAEQGNVDAADVGFFQASQKAVGGQSKATVACNHAQWLSNSGRPEAAMALLEPWRDAIDVQRKLAEISSRHGFWSASESAWRTLCACMPSDPAAWLGAARACLAQHRPDRAHALLTSALSLHARSADIQLMHAQALRLDGQVDAALSAVDAALEQGITSPGLLDLRNGLLLDLARPSEAFRGARRLAESHPTHLPGLETLAHIVWEHGERLGVQEDPVAWLEKALTLAPQNPAARQRLISLLLSMNRLEEVISRLDGWRIRGHDDPLSDWFRAEALTRLNRLNAAEQVFSQVADAFTRQPAFQNARARLALRRGHPQQAAAHAQQALGVSRFDQEALSLLATAWRVVGDSRADWLNDVDRLVGFVPVDCPAGFASMSDFLAELRNALVPLHQSGRQPLLQSVRQGSQTAGRLFGRQDPVIALARSSLKATVCNWLQQLPDEKQHPFLCRRSDDVSIVGSWSVLLRNSGHHANHIHSEGWLSSAFYVSLPDVGPDGMESLPGALQLGKPMKELGLELDPLRVITPRQGWLALFPSYMWHGTIPFHGHGAERLSIAFDMQPIA